MKLIGHRLNLKLIHFGLKQNKNLKLIYDNYLVVIFLLRLVIFLYLVFYIFITKLKYFYIICLFLLIVKKIRDTITIAIIKYHK
jgi:hypothetical protein